MVRAVVDVGRTGSEEWTVEVRLPGRDEPLARRSMARVDGLPALRGESGGPPDAGDFDAKAAFERVVMLREPLERDVEGLGAYLFAALLGDDLWRALVAAVGSEGIELALRWPAADADLGRLPWELMHGPDGFLVADPRRAVAVTRLVSESAAELDELPSPLRVLFVVGTTLTDRSIRAGAEYLGLLRRLKARGMSFTSQVLTEATADSLVGDLERFRPTVVHFICHGRTEDGETQLELCADDDPRRRDPVNVDQLLAILQSPTRSLPQVVVVSACHSGGTPMAQQVAPMAARLVHAGIPVVVGMSGEVADRACRLFTRRFYEALLQGESIPEATAEGRRAGHSTGADPRLTVDWALPTLFLSEAASATVRLEPQRRDLAARLYAVADGYRTMNNPKVFCGRLEFVEHAYPRLMRREDAGGRGGPSVLGARVAHFDHGIKNARYGKTRLLQELAAKAAGEGHVACLLSFGHAEDTPTTLPRLALALAKAIIETRTRLAGQKFQISTRPELQTLALLELELPPTAETPAEARLSEDLRYQRRIGAVERALWDAPVDAVSLRREEVSTALREDIASLAAEARTELPEAKVLVLVDEVHSFDAAAGDFVELLDVNGLGKPGDPAPVVFTFSASTPDARYSTAIRELVAFLESGRSYVERLDLEPFPSPAEDPLPYRQFLLHGPAPPLIVRRALADDKLLVFYELLGDAIQGVPSQLQWPTAEVETFLRAAKILGDCLEEADDEAVLAELRRA